MMDMEDDFEELLSAADLEGDWGGEGDLDETPGLSALEYEVEFASSNVARDIHKLAKIRGCTPVLPGEREILLDLDTDEDYELLKLQLERANNYHFYSEGAPIVIIDEWRSQSGVGRHAILKMPFDVDNTGRVLWQAMLGSDRKRELFNMLRLLKSVKDPITLFRPQVPADGG